VALDSHDTASDDSGTQTAPPVAIAPLVTPVSHAIDQNATPPKGRLSHASSSTPSTVNRSTSAVQALLLLAQGPVPDMSDVSQDSGSAESGSCTNRSASWGHRAEAIQLYQDRQGGSYLAYPTPGMTPAPARERRMPPAASPVPTTQISLLVAPVADPAQDAIPSSQPPLRQRFPDPDSAYHLAMHLRQEVAEKKAAAADERYGELAQDVRQANAAAASTATLVQSMMDRLDANHQDSINRVTNLATTTSTSQDRDTERWNILETKLIATREVDSEALNARITPLVTELVARATSTIQSDGAAARAALLDTLNRLRTQPQDRAQTSTAVLTGIQAAAHELQHTRPDVAASHQPPPPPAPGPPDSSGPSYTRAPSAPPTPQTSVVGSGPRDVPPVFGPRGGPGTGGVGQEGRNSYAFGPVTAADRARHLYAEQLREREHEHALQLDYAEARGRQERSRDTQAGVSVVMGRGTWPPSASPPGLREPWSIIGQGSFESYQGYAQPLTFTGSDLHSRYARTALFGGEATDSDVGKAYQSKTALRKFSGKNRGITDSPTTGCCALTYLNQIIALHSSCKHGSDSTRMRAMRQDLLSNLDDTVRDAVAAYDEEGTWLGLVNHFLQTCGPQTFGSRSWRCCARPIWTNPPGTCSSGSTER